ncbi:MAG: DUF1273 family protein [Oscillospiraceae bacterium]|nr:DUF1273 family protein [Oscillospiraceae bacterium]MBQ8979174.1 DUF1273 family protein [Oscillospiraceae bacterium]
MYTYDREKAVCFTGHRPEKLPDGGNDSSTSVKLIKSLLYTEIDAACAEGYDTFITGMQRGVDLWAGEIVLELMNSYDIHLWGVLPYKGFGSSFRDKDRWLYGRIIDSSDRVVTICDRYEPGCMNRRNEYMVDHSSLLIAVMGDTRSGSASTVRYAARRGVEVRNIDPGMCMG